MAPCIPALIQGRDYEIPWGRTAEGQAVTFEDPMEIFIHYPGPSVIPEECRSLANSSDPAFSEPRHTKGCLL